MEPVEYKKRNHDIIVNERWRYQLTSSPDVLTVDLATIEPDADDDGRTVDYGLPILEAGVLFDGLTSNVQQEDNVFRDICERRAALMAAAPTLYQAIEYAIKHGFDVASIRRLKGALSEARPVSEWPSVYDHDDECAINDGNCEGSLRMKDNVVVCGWHSAVSSAR